MNIVKMISKFNFTPGTIARLKDGFIVIHYTGALGTARNSCTYFAGGDRQASAHYFVDYSGEVCQSVEDQNSAWHCGSSTGYKHPKCRNSNSIGIEMCCKTTGNTKLADANWYFEDATVAATIELTKELMAKYNIPADHVIRHFDVTGKTCPAPYVYNTGKHTWDQFKAAIQNTSNSSSKNQNELNSQKADEIGWKAFINAGYSAIVAAGFLGNLNAESGLIANNLQNTFEKILGMNDSEYTAAVDSGKYTKEQFYRDGAGYGLAQWTYWSRKKAMYEFIVERRNKSIGDAESQFAFLLNELSTSYGSLVTKLKAAKTVKEASDLVLQYYEAPADMSDKVKELRASYAQSFYDKFASASDKAVAAAKTEVPFIAIVNVSNLIIRKGPGTNYDSTGKYTGIGAFTIVEVSEGKGSNSGWGLLKAYQAAKNGWISLDHVTKK